MENFLEFNEFYGIIFSKIDEIKRLGRRRREMAPTGKEKRVDGKEAAETVGAVK